ncbi:MAG: [FeFe] hydrogenase H-cluster radical SAM maturase HydE [Peptococcia bacterium]|jgi:biotin synthase
MQTKIISLLEQIATANKPNCAQLLQVLACVEHENRYLWQKADEIRKKYCGDEVHIRGIIEFSNYCRCDCLYCGIQRQNKILPRYRMEPDEIVSTAKKAYQIGYKTIVLQSGEDPYYTKDIISYIVKKIKQLGDIAITLSIGEREYQEYAQWKKDGADRYLLKHETADNNLFQQLHPHSHLEKRLECLHWLKSLGYQTGSGFIIGLPGQSLETIAQDLLLLKKLDVDMAGIGPFIPHPHTPLGKTTSTSTTTNSSLLTLKAVALARIILKRAHLPTTTALEVATNTNAFNTGANVIMRKVEPLKYRKLYDIYPHPFAEEKNLAQERQEVEKFVRSIGRTISLSKGDAL